MKTFARVVTGLLIAINYSRHDGHQGRRNVRYARGKVRYGHPSENLGDLLIRGPITLHGITSTRVLSGNTTSHKLIHPSTRPYDVTTAVTANRPSDSHQLRPSRWPSRASQRPLRPWQSPLWPPVGNFGGSPTSKPYYVTWCYVNSRLVTQHHITQADPPINPFI